jgi:hypothetical protein
MKIQRLLKFIFICTSFLFVSCNTATPEHYFGLAVLNSNMFAGFAEEGGFRELKYASAKMNEKGEAVPMQRSETMKTKIEFLDEEFSKIKELKETADTKDMLQTSKALYEFVLPVYKTEYVQLAKLYDNNAPEEKIESETKAIHDKYYSGFKERYDKLIAIGKIYAAQHSIKVNWADE